MVSWDQEDLVPGNSFLSCAPTVPWEVMKDTWNALCRENCPSLKMFPGALSWESPPSWCFMTLLSSRVPKNALIASVGGFQLQLQVFVCCLEQSC